MPKFRRLSVLIATLAILLLVFSSVATAHHGHGWGRGGFDNVCIGDADPNTFPGDLGCDTNTGRDKFIGKGGADVLSGGDLRDLIRGGRGDDEVNGDDGNDRLFGGPGGDTITDGTGRDLVKAGRGDDTITLTLDGKRDVAICGPGTDTVFADLTEDWVAPNCEIVNP